VTPAQNWWFWLLVAIGLGVATALSGRYRALVARARRAALERGLVSLPPGRMLSQSDRGFWSDISWLAFPAGVWVIASPWIWGYDDASGAVATDAVSGAVVLAVALVGVVFPAVWALGLGAGLWLVIAPWLVGYGDANGPVGLSDVVAGLLVCAVAIASLAGAERRVRAGASSGAVGRIRPPYRNNERPP